MKFRNIPFDITHAKISLSDSGDLVAASTGYKIIVWAFHVRSADGTKTLKVQSGASTDLTGAMAGASIDADAICTGDCAIPVFETALSEKLNLVCSAAVGVAGWLSYSLAKE